MTIDLEDRDLSVGVELGEGGIILFATLFGKTDGAVGVVDLLEIKSDADTPGTGAAPVRVENGFFLRHDWSGAGCWEMDCVGYWEGGGWGGVGPCLKRGTRWGEGFLGLQGSKSGLKADHLACDRLKFCGAQDESKNNWWMVYQNCAVKMNQMVTCTGRTALPLTLLSTMTNFIRSGSISYRPPLPASLLLHLS